MGTGLELNVPQYQVGKILCMKYTQKEHQLQFPIDIVPPKKGAQIFSVVILLANSANLALYAYLRLFADPIGLMSPRWERYNTNILCHTLEKKVLLDVEMETLKASSIRQNA